MRTLRLVFIRKLFQSSLQVAQFKSHGVSLVLFMSRRLGYLLRICSRLLGRNLAQQNTSLETPVIIASLIPKAANNSHCTWSQRFTIRVYETQHGFHRHFECQWDVPGWWNPFAHASWRKSISPSNVRNLTCGVISTTEWFHSKLQATGGEKDFLASV